MDDYPLQSASDPRILRDAAIKSRQIAGRYGYLSADAEDISQELLLELIRRLPTFDPERGAITTFARHVFTNRLATLIATQKARCRDYRLRLSMHGHIDRVGHKHLQDGDVEAALIRRQDVPKAVAQLPPAMRDICSFLMTLDSPAEVAAAVGISRATLYRRLGSIRDGFERAGILGSGV